MNEFTDGMSIYVFRCLTRMAQHDQSTCPSSSLSSPVSIFLIQAYIYIYIYIYIYDHTFKEMHTRLIRCIHTFGHTSRISRMYVLCLQVFDQTGATRPIDVSIILAATPPPACQPGGAGYTTSTAQRQKEHPETPRIECTRLRTEYRVVPGKSWGGLPASLEERWRDLDCDRMSVAVGNKRRRGAGKGGAGRAGLLLGS